MAYTGGDTNAIAREPARETEAVFAPTATVKSIDPAAFMDQAGSDYILAVRVLHACWFNHYDACCRVTDVWEEFFYPEEDVGGEIRCTTLRGFLAYLCSASTYGVGVEKFEKFTRYCALQVVGPECARQGRLYVRHELSPPTLSTSLRGRSRNSGEP